MTGSATHPQSDPAAAPPLRDAAADWLDAVRHQFSAILSLCTTEVRYSGLMLIAAVALGLIAALAFFSAWGLLLAAGVSALMGVGLSLTASLAIVALVNVLVVVLSIYLMRKALSRVGLDATRSALRIGDDDDE